VHVSHRAMFTSEKHFRDPYSFVPERWLGDERYKTDNRSTLQPFSYGPRNCIGKRLVFLRDAWEKADSSTPALRTMRCVSLPQSYSIISKLNFVLELEIG
jgi:hypothetical protein